MKTKHVSNLKTARTDWTPEGLGLDPARYRAVINYLFDRPVPEGQMQEWYWDDDLEVFIATSLEWTRFQTAIFANAAVDLGDFNDEQVGMGLNYLVDSGKSDVPFAAIETSVPLDEAMQMMQAMKRLWRDCIGPRMSSVHAPIGSGAGGRLGYVCHMWFDLWPTFYSVQNIPAWGDAVWDVLSDMLTVPCRAVQIAALHGIGHEVNRLDRQEVIDAKVLAFVASLNGADAELRSYAEAARVGNVQ